MWRAFFLAIGTMLIVLGAECLVVDQFSVSQEGKFAKVVNKVIDVIEGKTEKGSNDAAGFGSINDGLTTQSPYGPSRFQDPFATGATSAPAADRPFGLAGFRNSDSNAAANGRKKTRKVPTQDWMPWSLLAAGTIVVLYTKSTSLGENLGYASQD